MALDDESKYLVLVCKTIGRTDFHRSRPSLAEGLRGYIDGEVDGSVFDLYFDFKA
jgi:hypothetical protein